MRQYDFAHQKYDFPMFLRFSHQMHRMRCWFFSPRLYYSVFSKQANTTLLEALTTADVVTVFQQWEK